MKILYLVFIFLLIGFIIISGCSKQNQDSRLGQRLNKNLTDEDKQHMFEQRQQLLIKACYGMDVGDKCILDNPRGKIDGICKVSNETLICMLERPAR